MEPVLTKHLVIAATDDAPEWDLGVIYINEDGIGWYWRQRPIYRATWEQWALQMTELSGGALHVGGSVGVDLPE
jgi:hypothetical protein